MITPQLYTLLLAIIMSGILTGCLKNSSTAASQSIPSLPATIEILQQPTSSQVTNTILTPALKVRVLDSANRPILNLPLEIQFLGTGTLSGTTSSGDASGVITWANLKADTYTQDVKLKISLGSLSVQTSAFNLTTRELPFAKPVYVSPIDGVPANIQNTHTVHNLTELKNLIYKRIDTNGDGVINNSDAYRWIPLAPGTKIIFANGTWSNIGKIYLGGLGQANHPVLFEAETRGGVTFTGTTEIYLYGSYLAMSGMKFTSVVPTISTDGSGVSTMANGVIFLGRTNKSSSISPDGIAVPAGGYPLACTYCAFRYNKFDNSAFSVNPNQTNPVYEYDDLGTHGQYNEISNNTFKGRNLPGHIMVVWRLPGVEDFARIYNNEFLDQIYAAGANGNEALRIGTGADTDYSSKSIVENNLFENVDGEIETVSVKSWDNVFRFNTFRNNKGSLCIRSAGRNLVEANYFLGQLKTGSGGIRAVRSDNLIVGNHIQDTNPGSVGDMSKNSGIVLPKGTTNPAANYYWPVINTKVALNMFSNNKVAWNLGADANSSLTNDTVDPTNVIFYGNLLKGKSNEAYVDRYSPFQSFQFIKNYATGGLLDSARTALADMSPTELPAADIVTQAWYGTDRPEDPMREFLRVSVDKLIEARFSQAEIDRVTLRNASLYDVMAPLERGVVGCGY